MIDADALLAAREKAGLSQAQLASLAKCSQQLIGALEAGTTLTTKFLPRIASVLGVPPGDLDNEYAGLPAPVGNVSRNIPAQQLMGERDFKIYAAVEGGAGQIIRSTDPVDFMPRPSPVSQVKDAYGLYVIGDSMVPEYRPGDIAIVNPHLPIIPDEVYIFYAEREGEARATIKHLRRISADLWHLRQWNPPDGFKQDFTLNRREWNICHRVLGKYSRQ